MRLGIPNGKTTTHVTLKDVLYCPDLVFTLVSLTRCDAAIYSVLLKDRKCWIRDTKGTLLGQVPLSNGLYKVEHKNTAAAANAARKPLTLEELHCRMAHFPASRQEAGPGRHGHGARCGPIKPTRLCTACVQAKPTRKPVPQKTEGPRATKFGEKIHLDVWGPANPQSYDGKEYFVSFTDDYNRWTYLVPMAKKSEAFGCYKQYEVLGRKATRRDHQALADGPRGGVPLPRVHRPSEIKRYGQKPYRP
jgi:hypothetical protein